MPVTRSQSHTPSPPLSSASFQRASLSCSAASASLRPVTSRITPHRTASAAALVMLDELISTHLS